MANLVLLFYYCFGSILIQVYVYMVGLIDTLLAMFEYPGKLAVVEEAIPIHGGSFEHYVHLTG